MSEMEFPAPFADKDYLAVLRRDPCAYCGGPSEALDHIEPRVAGGSDGWDNLTAACKSCNSSKTATPLLLSMAGRQARAANGPRPKPTGSRMEIRLSPALKAAVEADADYLGQSLTTYVTRALEAVLDRVAA